MGRRIVINGRFLTQPITGVQRYGREVVSALASILRANPDASHRFQFEILVPSDAPHVANFHPIPVKSVGRWSGQVWEQWELPRHAGDTIILNFANTAAASYRRQIVTIHDASVFAAPEGYSLAFRLWYRALHKRLTKRADVVVTDSEFSKRELVKHCGLDASKCRVIPLGAEHILRESADVSVVERMRLKNREFVLCAGSLNPNKNLVALVETAHRLRDRNYPLVVAGSGNERVFRSAAIPFPENVKYTGYISDAQLRGLYESAGCFVFPSRYEGFGLPPLEAMACGCPVVSSNAASLPEVCGTTAQMCHPAQPGAIAETVLAVVTDSSKAAEMAAAGRAHAANFRWETAAWLWLDVLEDIHPG